MEKTIEELQQEYEDNQKRIAIMEKKKEQDAKLKELETPMPDTKKPNSMFMFNKDSKVTDTVSVGGKDTLPKKVAALELYRLHGRTNIISIISLSGIVISLLFYAFMPMMGAGIAVILTAILGMFMVMSKKEMIRLKKEYKFD